eukprot:TRINITY_DN63591_c0_g1_i1.p1 TRINITY_DN63591_c0_g1~~TRINITY_DN63591_c0_g1_i1.p1  ORF type:complete len:285 (+),score=51.50 TRINITY_DN63591_c0_g1_i1:99-953(+)
MSTPLMFSEALASAVKAAGATSDPSTSALTSMAALKSLKEPTPIYLENFLPPASPPASPSAITALKAAAAFAEIDSLFHFLHAYNNVLASAGFIRSRLANPTFSFTLRKADDVELGLTVSPTDGNLYLRIECIHREGAVDAWNRQCCNSPFPEKVVVRGDVIISVNGKTQNTEQMLEECKNKQLLKFQIYRGGDDLSTVPIEQAIPRKVATAGAPAVNVMASGASEETAGASEEMATSLRAGATTFVPKRAKASISGAASAISGGSSAVTGGPATTTKRSRRRH